MKIVIAPDKYKGSLTGINFCRAAEQGIKKVIPDAEVVKIPLADGGDGTIEALLHSLSGEKIKVIVNDPLFRKIEAYYLWVEDQKTAVIEMAEASGISLLTLEERNCMYTTSLGTGELIDNALSKGAKTIVLAIGGSATNDAGIGMATALGYQFLNIEGEVLKPIGAHLNEIVSIDDSAVDLNLKNITFKIACDVKNPLYGINGAAYVYGAQKGASLDEIQLLDMGLRNLAKVISNQFKVDCQLIEGSGAAGGMGAGAIVFLCGELASGIGLVKEITDFDNRIKGADWIITGEGSLDNQTFFGKAIHGVLTSAKKKNIPVAAFCGSLSISEKEQEELGLVYATSVLKRIGTLNEAMESAYDNLIFSVCNFTRLIK